MILVYIKVYIKLEEIWAFKTNIINILTCTVFYLKQPRSNSTKLNVVHCELLFINSNKISVQNTILNKIT